MTRATLALAAAALLAGCTGAPTNGRIFGRTFSLDRDGVDPSGALVPVRATRRLTPTQGQMHVVHTSAKGAFTTSVRPGMYRIAVTGPSTLEHCRMKPAATVHVRSGRTVSVTIDCRSMITGG